MKRARRDALRMILAGAGSLLFGASRAGHAAQAPPPAAPLPPGPLAWDALRAAIDGEVIVRGDEAYEERRAGALWNARKPERRPEALVRVASVADVRETMRHAHARGLKVAVRGGGHSFWGAPVRDGGILLDLAALNEIKIDVSSRTALVGPAARGRDLAAALALEGLAFPVGHCSTVALGGYLLAGGIGWNTGAWGPACASVQGIQVVTADGKMQLADARRNQDLLWAARGAGPGFFGVVTRFDLRLQALPRAIHTSTFVYALKDLDRIAGWLPEVMKLLRPDVEVTCIIGLPPQGGAERVLTIMATAFANTEDEARKWLEPLETLPVQSPIAAIRMTATPLDALFTMMDGAFPSGMRYAGEIVWTDAAPADFFARIRDIVATAPSPRSFFMAVPMPPAADAVAYAQRPGPGGAPPSMALSKTGRAALGPYSVWDDAAKDAENIAWVAKMAKALAPIATGSYVGETDLTAASDRALRCFSPEAWTKLKSLREHYDPTGVFHSYPV